jgi:leucyl aminopeptidase
MKVAIKDIKDVDYASDALILPFCEGEGATPYKAVDSLLDGLISKVFKSGEFEGKPDQLTVLHTINRIKPRRVVLLGIGKKDDLTNERLRQAGGRAFSQLYGIGCREISLSGRHILSLGRSPAALVEGGLLSLYKLKRYKKEKDGSKGIKKVTLMAKPVKALSDSMRWIVATTTAVNFAKDLVNTPSNDMTPSVLAKTARSLSGGKVSVRVLERADTEREGMGAFLSVAKGSKEPPKFIVLKYNGGRGAPIAIVGKSITFDSGGISIKPSEGMEKMKYDMAGGAVVLALIKAASGVGLPVNLIGVLPATENLPGGAASKPGDIVTSMTGKTIEIISTDAEGRLVLADAIGYVKKFGPRVIIDVATLTGACSVALGNEAIGMMGNDVKWMDGLRAAGEETYERVWQMPLYEEYMDYIKSDLADIKNSGGRTGSFVTAGFFLKEFAGDTPWVHLDIAGTAWTEKDKPYTPKGATGIGVRLLLNLLKEIK